MEKTDDIASLEDLFAVLVILKEEIDTPRR